MQVPPVVIFALAVPTLLLGQLVLRCVRPLARLNLPMPVVGGFIVALAVFALQASGHSIELVSKTANPWWTFWVTTETPWGTHEPQSLILPLLVIFYTTLGLEASANVIRKGGLLLALYLFSTLLASVMQNFAGISAAKALGQHPALGMVCGSVSLMGGFSTAIGFTQQFEKLGFPQVAGATIVAATFGLVMSNVVSAPIATLLIRRKKLAAEVHAPDLVTTPMMRQRGIIDELRELRPRTPAFWKMALLLLVCAKLSAYVTALITLPKVTFPVQVGAMIAGLLIRLISDLFHLKLVDSRTNEAIGSVALSLFLAVAMMTLDLTKLSGIAVPMLIILSMQVVLLCLYALTLNFKLMGGDYEAAVTSAGLLGFGLGATPNAIASMRSLTSAFGPAPRAFQIVPVTGAFLSDIVNVLTITLFLNLLA